MKFEEILPLLRNGQRVATSEMAKGHYLQLADGKLCLYERTSGEPLNRGEYFMSARSLLSEEWKACGE